MRLRVRSYDELAAMVDLSEAPPGYRAVVELDLLAHGPITRHSLPRFAVRPSWAPVSRGEIPDPPGDWATRAACVGERMFYETHQAHSNRLTRSDRAIEARALEVCASCPVLALCREWALQPAEPAVDHVAGGLTPRQRHQYRRLGIAP